MTNFFRGLVLMALLFQLTACSTFYQPKSVQFKDYTIRQNQPVDNDVNALLQPYADSVNKSMNDVIAIADIALDKKQPEGRLNNLLADAMINIAKEKFKTNIQVALVNYGGIRLPSLPAGNITRGKIFELSPFDNLVVLLNIKGDTLKQLLDHIAFKGGWPCSGISYQLKDKKAVNILIDGAALDQNRYYNVATLDYIANGGDDCVMLKPITQLNIGLLFRDAIIAYFSAVNRQGKKITASIENRVTNAD